VPPILRVMRALLMKWWTGQHNLTAFFQGRDLNSIMACRKFGPGGFPGNACNIIHP
jgi:hypothetical protein